ncbi:unnamed protein product [Eruca vesicaria subsp. sativa]|uniref:Uncharacterized protein n=1 Tax=Eruca vesicaria subsp. sativa TaxID=29727 RepID=A0ABC8IXM7_ERUVS|nr:unnamed protein product [Eruca vesicaria subsp. sativa]
MFLILQGRVNILSLGKLGDFRCTGGSSQEAEDNALTLAKCRGTTVFNLEEHYDENSCSILIKKEKTDKSD